ncbi:MAG: sulfatase-like hydrolase/transferase [Pseudomonadota bacterium]
MSNLNVLFLFSDEHRFDAMGCAGHALVKTPQLDALAKRGTRFERAYTTSPICVPARASLASGQYVHKTRCWSNAQAYSGTPKSWGHALQAVGRRVDSIGKLHYRGNEFDNGFDNEILPMYIRDGVGWIKGLLRNHEAVLDCSQYAREIGVGDSTYTDYDLGVTQEACRWIEQSDNADSDKPWALFVSWLRPHYPLTCPREFFDLYPLDEMDEARFLDDSQLPKNKVLQTIRNNFDYDQFFTPQTRQIARASYYGLCSFLDDQIGQVLAALEASGQADNTLIIYTSDHGDHNGDRRLWTKMTLYDESARVPMIIAGPGVEDDRIVSTLASLVDIYPTILSASGVDYAADDFAGLDLRSLARKDHFSRVILSEYHDGGSPTGMFMLRTDDWKYNVYPGYAAELYDMRADPDELNDLGQSNEHSEIRANLHQTLLSIADPERENDQAFADQNAMIDSLGGVDAIFRSEEYDFTPVGS